MNFPPSKYSWSCQRNRNAFRLNLNHAILLYFITNLKRPYDLKPNYFQLSWGWINHRINYPERCLILKEWISPAFRKANQIGCTLHHLQCLFNMNYAFLFKVVWSPETKSLFKIFFEISWRMGSRKQINEDLSKISLFVV